MTNCVITLSNMSTLRGVTLKWEQPQMGTAGMQGDQQQKVVNTVRCEYIPALTWTAL